LAATRVNVGNGYVDWRAMGILGVVGAATAPLATLLALQIPAATLSRVFGLFLIALAIQTIVKNRKAPEPVPA
ncbi:MAG: TSUP family transporter, partial [Acidimicrobiia bacterium]